MIPAVIRQDGVKRWDCDYCESEWTPVDAKTLQPIATLVKIICNGCLGRLSEFIMKRDIPKLCNPCQIKLFGVRSIR